MFGLVFLSVSVRWNCESRESDEGAVSAAGAVVLHLLLSELNTLILEAALPQARRLQDLLHQLLEGTLDAVSGLGARL